MQLRNILMVCTLFATGTAYIGARAFPTAFLDDSYSYELFRLNVRPSAPHKCLQLFLLMQHALWQLFHASMLVSMMQSALLCVENTSSSSPLVCEQPCP